MSIFGADGRQISTGPTGRKIIIEEIVAEKGRSSWGVQTTAEMDILEAVQVLGDVIRAIAQNQRQIRHESKVMNEVKAKMDEIAKGDSDVK